MQRLQLPSRQYTAGTRNFDIPPSVQRKFTAMKAILTREAWPGQSTFAVGITGVDTVGLVAIGDGGKFPAAGGRLSLTRADGEVEIAQLLSRSGDALTLARAQEGTTALTLVAGAVVRLLDLVTVRLERTLDGVNWTQVAAFTVPGGVLIVRGQTVLTSSATFGFTDAAGAPLSQDGDLRAVIVNRVTLQTAITLEMEEPL